MVQAAIPAIKPGFFKLRDLSIMYQVSPSTLVSEIKKGSLKAQRIGRQWRVPMNQAYLQQFGEIKSEKKQKQE